MEFLRSIDQLREFRGKWRRDEEAVGFVPSMGALHEGHLSLVQASRTECRRTVVSIFVNPLQFAPTEDFDAYPRSLSRDREILEDAGVDALFYPDPEEIYPPGFSTEVRQTGTTEFLCGASRPHFFGGVLTVVLKLLNAVQPNRAYFGRKDAQQAVVVGKMIRELHLDVELRVMPIVREPDGLARSSRNRYLEAGEREQATSLIRGLREAKKGFEAGERDAEVLKGIVRGRIESAPGARIDYVELVELPAMRPVSVAVDPSLLAVAVFFGSTRLIDNVLLGDDFPW